MLDAIIVAIIGAVGAVLGGFVGGVTPIVVQHWLQRRQERRAPQGMPEKERSGFFWEALAALPAAVVGIGSYLLVKHLGYSERIAAIALIATGGVSMLISSTLLKIKM